MSKIFYFLVINEYNEDLAKRQPWYSIKELMDKFKTRNIHFIIIRDLSELPSNYDGTVLKVFGLNDFFKFSRRNYRLIYLMTFPLYPFKQIIGLPLRVLLENWNSIKRIVIASLIPNFIIRKVLNRVDEVVVISDRSESYLSSFRSTIKIIPFSMNNWGDQTFVKRNNVIPCIGYFGPPYTTRDFKEIIEFFKWCSLNGHKFKKKIITRLDREGLQERANNYLEIIKDDPDLNIVSGFLSREELLTELSDIDFLLLPFKIVMSELPIVVLEALELGIPVVTTLESGIFDIAQNQQNILFLNKFSKDEYNRVVNFIEIQPQSNFIALKNSIDKLNEESLDKLCQS